MLKFYLLLLSAVGIANYSAAQDCSLRLTGHVEDADIKDKLTGATVMLNGQNRQVITDTTGDFSFDGLCAGEYVVRITHINCEPLEQKVHLDKNRHVDIFLPHARQTLGEVVVNGQKGIPNTGFKEELSGKLLDQTKGQSISEALSHINGVNLLQTGSTISKPIIHGLHSSRILMINNGVRQEGQQWGNEHAPEIDPFIADKLVVIKGVDELKYGSDAIGGVILVEPKALRAIPGYHAELNAGYFTNNRQYVVSGMFEQQLKKYPSLTYRIQGTYKRAANAATPDYRLNNTGSDEVNFSLAAGWKRKNFNTELFYSQFATKLGIFTGSHIGNLSDLQKAIASSKPDDIFLGQQTYKIQRPYQDVAHYLLKSKSALKVGENRFNLLIAGQYDHRKEYDIVRSSANKKPQLDLTISTLSEDLNWEQPKKNYFSGVIGISGVQQDNSYGGRYFIPNYFSYTFGGYAIEKWNKHNWELQGGMRYDNKTINTTRLKFNGEILNHNFNFSTLASSAGATYKLQKGWKFNGTFSLASRAPYVNELLSDGIHDGTATYEKGDIALTPEHSFNVSGNINYEHPDNKFSLDLNVYSNHINNFIYQQPVPDSPVLTIAGAFPLIEYRQTNAVLNGFDLAGSIKFLSNRFDFAPKLSVLYARDTKVDDWLIWMPANRISAELTYNFKNGKQLTDSYISAEVEHVMRQHRIPSDKYGKQDYKDPPAAYTLVSMNASTTVHANKMPIEVSISARNLFDVAYRDYLNRFRYYSDEMGRNIGFRLRIPLDHAYHN